MTGKRGNGEGSIYPYKNGFAAYVWVTKPDGKRARKYAYGKTRDEVHDKWLNLHAEARKGPVATRHRTLAVFLSYWLDSIVKPNLAPLSYVSYEGYVRLYITPHLGSKRLDRLTVRDVREWLTKLGTVCQCCAQGKDAKRAPSRRKCCAVGDCCESYPSRRVIQASRDALRAALTHAVTEEEIGKNVASLVKVPKPRRRRIKPWSVAEAGQFLAEAAARDDHLFAAWVLVLTLGLRRGEVLGLTWKSIDFDAGELYVDHQIQRAGRQILHRETKTEDSDDFLPCPPSASRPSGCVALSRSGTGRLRANSGRTRTASSSPRSTALRSNRGTSPACSRSGPAAPASGSSLCGTPGTHAARSWSRSRCTRRSPSESFGTRRSL